MGGGIARDCGEAAAKAGDKVKKFDQKHKVTDKALDVVAKIVGRVKYYDQKHEVSNKTKNAMGMAGDKVKEFDNKHKVTDKTMKGITNGLNWVSMKMDSPSNSNNDRSTAMSQQQRQQYQLMGAPIPSGMNPGEQLQVQIGPSCNAMIVTIPDRRNWIVDPNTGQQSFQFRIPIS